jgi:M6 family metalloprotease-like protein
MNQPAPRLRFWISVLLSSAMLVVLTGPSLAVSAQPAQAGGAPPPQGRGGGGRGEAPPAIPALPPIDRQVVRDQDDMTWAADYKPIPGVNWAADTRAPSERTIKIAMVLFDFEDQPFVVTLPKRSDPFGNPQIDPIKREDVPRFYHDFWNKPQPLNYGRSVHEYWMELSHGRIGVEFTPFGPYRIPGPYTKGHGNAEMADAVWRAVAGEDVRKGFDLVMRIYAGYDETTVWQEFGEMKFQTRDDIKPPFCNPADPKVCWLDTRYTDWTSWLAGSYLWSNSGINMGESSGSIRHEISHAAFRIGDNNNNPYVTPYRRVGAGGWDVMDRGSFNGPGGPHRRWLIPVTEGGAAPAGLLLRQRMFFKFTGPGEVLSLNRDGLAQSGLAVARVTARAHKPLPDELTGIVVRLDGDAPQDRTPPSDPTRDPLSQGVQNYNSYTLEVVQRIGYDSFTPSGGVLITKNKDQASPVGGPNSFNLFNWVIDANPEDIQEVDFTRPNGDKVMRTIADYRQLNDATFHAGLNSGSDYEWVDLANRLHFYIVDVHHAPNGLLSYTLAARSLDGSGPHERGVALAAPGAQPAAQDGRAEFILSNTGKRAPTPAPLHPDDATRFLNADVYRISVSVQGAGWAAQIQNALATVPFGGTHTVPVFVSKTANAADSAIVTVRAASESDPTKKAVTTYVVRK